MKKEKICICGNKAEKNGLCEECLWLLRAKKSKNIGIVEKFRADYNARHNTYKTYGQFVAMIDLIDRRRKLDDRRKKATAKKVWGNRR